MATLSDYTSGTISLANGSVTVTGTGTLFEVTRFREGDTLQIQNLTAVIASVDSDTQLTLTEPWTGTTIVDGPYRARQLGDGSRVSTQAATVIELLGNGVLTSLAELGVEEGKVPVGGPTGEYELADLVQDPNGSLGKLAALTLAARQILQTDQTGALKTVALAANKFLRTDVNGDIALSDIAAWAISMLGLAGAANKFPYLNDVNTAALADITALGRAFLALTGTNGNIPVMTGAGTVASRPIVGTVSQSGGIPTGAIVEVGGDITSGYMRLAGGVQICWRTNQTGIPNTNVAAGSIFAGTSYSLGNFAAAFVSVPAVICGGTGSSGGGWMAQDIYHTATSWGSFSARSAGNTGIQVQFFALAIGKYY